MSVLRNKLRKKYLTLPNEIIEDSRLSSGAFRVFCYISSKNDGWKVRNKDIQNRLNIKQAQTLANYLKELVESGWLFREKSKDEKGNFIGGFDYHIMEKPYYGKTLITEKPKSRENHIHSNTDSFSKTEELSNTKDIKGYSFDEFWFDYDKKVGPKDRIQKKFEKLSQKDRELISIFIPKYKIAQPEKKFRKNPETFLNQKSWNDEIINANGKSNEQRNSTAKEERVWNT